MRLSVVVCALCLAACSTTPGTVGTLSNEPAEGCEVTDCFNQLQIRDFELVDPTTLVLYVGSQRCPFKVSFEGAFCDLTFLPGSDIEFTIAVSRRGLRGIQPIGTVVNMQICSHDRQVGIADDEYFGFSRAGGAPIEPGRLPCEILDVASLTDDELIELYVDNNIVAPLPPFGTGQIAVPEGDAAEEGASETTVGPGASDDQAAEAQTGQPTAAVQSQ